MSIVNRFPTSCPDSDTFIPQNLEPMFGVEVKPLDTVSSPPVSTDPAEIASKEGLVVLTKVTAGAYLLGAPIAGLPSAGGDDGRKLEIVDGSGHAHTVTTPANGINGANHILTAGGTKGQSISLKAYNGTWLANGSITGFAIT
jgi:hypothetical protein